MRAEVVAQPVGKLSMLVKSSPCPDRGGLQFRLSVGAALGKRATTRSFDLRAYKLDNSSSRALPLSSDRLGVGA
jgi:hypothetical protein